jgi:pyrroloquinoline quinone biosynthesis protein B
LLLLQVVKSVDLALLDACFYDAAELPGRDMSQVPHPLITDTLQRLKGLTAETAVVLVHMNHSNPVWREGSQQRAAVLQAGFELGQQGAVYEL